MGVYENSRVALLVVVVVVVVFAAGEVAEAGDCSSSNACDDSSNCCSQYGYCGTSDAYCGDGCQNGPCSGSDSSSPSTPSTPSTPSSPSGGSGWSSFFSESDFDNWFPYRQDFYSYSAFTDAANYYSSFGTSGSTDDQKREVAAFFGNVQQESGGLQFVNEQNPGSDYCDNSNQQYPCASGKSYYGRGPIQISWNYNYGVCGDALNMNLLENPEQVANDAGTAFKTALWFWMTSGCHSASSFASTIRIINGDIECNQESTPNAVRNRVNAYTRFCQSLGVDPGSDLYC